MPRALPRFLAFVAMTLQLAFATPTLAQSATESELSQAVEQTKTAIQALADSTPNNLPHPLCYELERVVV